MSEADAEAGARAFGFYAEKGSVQELFVGRSALRHVAQFVGRAPGLEVAESGRRPSGAAS